MEAKEWVICGWDFYMKEAEYTVVLIATNYLVFIDWYYFILVPESNPSQRESLYLLIGI